jgi:tight adherence protein B
MSKRPEEDEARVQALESAASVVQKLAVLLSAGVSPASAWRYLADDDPGAVLEAVAHAAGCGESITVALTDLVTTNAALSDAAWRALAAAWLVATESGAPLAQTLHGLAASLRDLAQTNREVQVALAAPRATARMVMVLPVVGILFGAALGFNTVATLMTTLPGLVCLASGAVLIFAARLWNGRLVRAARPADTTPGLVMDLTAIAISGGVSTDRARAMVARASAACGISLTQHSAVDGVLALSNRAGIPAAGLLRSAAEQSRRTSRSDGARSAATLSVMLMLPLGLCILPAFMVLGVAPLLITVISSTVSAI